MKIGIIYATYSSGTLTVSEIIQEELQKMNHEPIVVNVGDLDPSTLTSYDLILMGSPTWWNNNSDGQPLQVRVVVRATLEERHDVI
jgi:flavodoxin